MTRFIVVPQWQGSSSARAMQLVDGALAIAGDLPRAATEVLEVPLEAGDALGTNVHRLSALLRNRDQLVAALDATSEPALVVGGDCGVAIGAVTHAARGGDLAVVWFDAHADYHTPDTSPSCAFHGMVLRAIAGAGPEVLALPPSAIGPGRIVLAGTREFDPEEEDAIAADGVTALGPDAVADPDALVAAVRATGATRVYVHVDLDVLDPAAITGIGFPTPFGVALADLVAAIGRLRAEFPLAGATITEFAPSSPDAALDDLGTILRIVGALA